MQTIERTAKATLYRTREIKLQRILTLSVSLSLFPSRNAIFTVELYKLSKLYLLAQVLLIAVRAS